MGGLFYPGGCLYDHYCLSYSIDHTNIPMKTLLLALFVSLFSLYVQGQTPSPYIENFDSFGNPGEWKLVTGQPNTGSHGGELCYNVSGTYIDDTYYSFESDTLDFSAWSTVEVIMVISSNVRNGDVFSFWYYEEVGGWTGYDISGIIGTRFFTIPNTAILLSFDLNTNANGNVNGKYGHVDYLELYTPTALPITLLDFTGDLQDQGVEINWSTASEENNNYFSLYRSTNAYDWDRIVTIPGAGNSTSTNKYQYFDNTVLYNTSYYKLEQTDYDGMSEEFKPIAVYREPLQEPEVIGTYDMLGRKIPSDQKGLVIERYKNGTSRKIYKVN